MSNFYGEIVHLSVVDSTNIYTSKKLSQFGMDEWSIVTADMQTAGKGQRSRRWHSEMGKNLLMSVVLKPNYVKQNQQFLVSAASGLAVLNMLSECGIKASLKWPNDVLINEKKVCGLLIENQWAKNTLESSIVGIGLNVNQAVFNEYDWPATSMTLETNMNFDLDIVRDLFLSHLYALMHMAKHNAQRIWEEYSKNLFAFNEQITFQFGNEKISGVLRGVDERGAILIESDLKQSSFVNGEIKIKRT